MLLPFAGLFMFFVPMAGLTVAIVLCCIRRFRFLAPFAFLVPLLASYTALACLFGTGIGLERLGYGGWIVNVAALAGFLIGGGLGGLVGLGGGLLVNRLAGRSR